MQEKGKQEVAKVVSFVKMVENIPSVSSPLKFYGQQFVEAPKVKASLYFEHHACNVILRFSTLGKIFNRQPIEVFFLFFPENRV